MKKYLILLLLLPLYAASTNFYMSITGSDVNTGLSISSPWKSIAKLNSMMLSMNVGDSVLFNWSDKFYGTIRPVSGIKFGVYGNGTKKKATISGFTQLFGWTGTGGIYGATTTLIKNNVNIVRLNGVSAVLGRTPNQGSYYYYTDTTRGIIASSSLIGAPSYLKAEVIRFNNSFQIDKGIVAAQGSNSLNYTATKIVSPSGSGTKALSKGTANYAWFVQKNLSCLDQYGEWFFDTASSAMKIYFGAINPIDVNVEVSTIDTLVNCRNMSNISFNDIIFEGGNIAAVYTSFGSNIMTTDCSFKNNTFDVLCNNSSNTSVINCTSKYAYCVSLALQNRQKYNITVTGCNIDSVGIWPGQGIMNYTEQLKGINVDTDSNTVGNTTLISNNILSHIGQAGIKVQGSNITVEKNEVSYSCVTAQDNGSLYIWFKNNAAIDGSDKRYKNRKFRYNILHDMPGLTNLKTPISNNNIDVAGLYIDDQSENVDCYGNTIYNIKGPGIQLNNPINQNIYDNWVYNCSIGIQVSEKEFNNISGLIIKKNVVYAVDTTQYFFYYSRSDLALPSSETLTQTVSTFGFTDSNYIYCRKTNFIKLSYYDGSDHFTEISFNNWKSIYGHDLVTVGPPITVTSTLLGTNPTNVTALFNFANQKNMDPFGNNFDNSYPLNPWRGVILLRNGNAESLPIPPGTPSGDTINWPGIFVNY
jgi:hypothetical protein